MCVKGLYEQDASSYTLLRALFGFMLKGSPRPFAVCHSLFVVCPLMK